jgi:CENP-Q, a CENPA-CAD centromere complex subunit
LTGHVDSIQGNLNQVKGITEAIAKSRAAVQAALFSHLESRQYEEVVLG